MFGFGLFCGSNGWWSTDVICKLKMHGHMLTEDIDSALRAYGSGKKAVHDMNVISYEMAPNTFAAFWKQRMRWTQCKSHHHTKPGETILTHNQAGPKLPSATSP